MGIGKRSVPGSPGKKVYIAGRRTDTPGWGTEAFTEAAEDLRVQGYQVVNPAESDDYMTGPMVTVDEDTYWRGLSRCLVRLGTCGAEAIVLLPGWDESRGARIEALAALLSGLDVLAYPTLEPVPAITLAHAWTGVAQPQNVAEEAQLLVGEGGARSEHYGDPVKNHTDIGIVWGVLLDMPPIPARTVAVMMAALKLVREGGPKRKRDNLVDACGYILIAERAGKAGAE